MHSFYNAVRQTMQKDFSDLDDDTTDISTPGLLLLFFFFAIQINIVVLCYTAANSYILPDSQAVEPLVLAPFFTSLVMAQLFLPCFCLQLYSYLILSQGFKHWVCVCVCDLRC